MKKTIIPALLGLLASVIIWQSQSARQPENLLVPIPGEDFKAIPQPPAHQQKFNNYLRSMNAAENVEQIIAWKLKLEEQMERHPELIQEIPQLLESESLSRRAELALIHTLQEQTGVQAEQVLSSVAEDSSRPAHQRLQALVTLGGRENLSESGVETLWRLYSNSSAESVDDISRTALLNLGVAVAAISEPERAEDLVLRIAEELYREQGNGSVALILDSLGNTSSRLVLNIVEPFLNSESAHYREEAAYALRAVPGEDVDELLLETVELEDDPGARRGAVQALLARPASEELIHAIGQLVLDEPEAELRHSMIQYLARFTSGYEASREYLLALLHKETSEDNYELITGALHQG